MPIWLFGGATTGDVAGCIPAVIVVGGPAWQMGSGASSRLGRERERRTAWIPAPALPQQPLRMRIMLRTATFTEGPQATHIPAHANPRSCLWSSQPPKSPAIQVKVAFRADKAFLPPQPQKKEQHGGPTLVCLFLSFLAAPGRIQHPSPAPDASSRSCFFLPRNPQPKPKQLANDDVFPNSTHTVSVCSLQRATVRHIFSAMSHRDTVAENITPKWSITHGQHAEGCEF